MAADRQLFEIESKKKMYEILDKNKCYEPKTKTLNIQFMKLTDDDIFHIIKYLEDNVIIGTEIETIDLKSNKITATGAAMLAEAATQFKQLKAINLTMNRIGDKGAIKLAAIPTLQSLNLSCCAITDVGFEALARSVSLKELKLAGNKITDSGVIAFSKQNPKSQLSCLHLQENHDITDIGFKELSTTCTIPQLNLDFARNISFSSIIRLMENDFLSDLSMVNCYIPQGLEFFYYLP